MIDLSSGQETGSRTEVEMMCFYRTVASGNSLMPAAFGAAPNALWPEANVR